MLARVPEAQQPKMPKEGRVNVDTRNGLAPRDVALGEACFVRVVPLDHCAATCGIPEASIQSPRPRVGPWSYRRSAAGVAPAFRSRRVRARRPSGSSYVRPARSTARSRAPWPTAASSVRQRPQEHHPCRDCTRRARRHQVCGKLPHTAAAESDEAAHLKAHATDRGALVASPAHDFPSPLRRFGAVTRGRNRMR
jgi:hypothetical protein